MEEQLTGDLLTRLPGMKASEAANLTPANLLRVPQGSPARKVA
jgi:hypothetical protein